MLSVANNDVVYSVKMARWWVNTDYFPTIMINVDDLEHHLEYPTLCDERGRLTTPIEVLIHPYHHENHVSRLSEVDLSQPVLLFPNGYIFDGIYNIMKAKRDNVNEVPIIIIPPHILPKFIICLLTKEIYDMDLTHNRDHLDTIRRLFMIRFGDDG